MQATTRKFTFKELNINPLEICQYMGYPKAEAEAMIPFVQVEMDKLDNLRGIEGGYRVTDIDTISENYTLNIEGKSFNVGKTIWLLLRKSEKVAIYICSAGDEISSISHKLRESGDLIESYIVDTIGSVIVERAMDLLHKDIENEVQESVTNRYSPGYSLWDVAQQRELFQLVPDNFCGVKLNNSALMSPAKSLSGVIGIGKGVKYLKKRCSICTQKSCQFKKEC